MTSLLVDDVLHDYLEKGMEVCYIKVINGHNSLPGLPPSDVDIKKQRVISFNIVKETTRVFTFNPSVHGVKSASASSRGKTLYIYWESI